MSRNDFASQLTNLGLPGNIDAATLAVRALQHNRRRIRLLAALTIGLWIITFLVVPGFWLPFAAKLKEQSNLLQNPSGGQVSSQILAQVIQESLLHIWAVSGAILGVTTIASLLAAISTVWLVLTVRRVTLEQLSLGLSQIAEELRRLRMVPSPGTPGEG